MCFSAQADLVGGAVVTLLGVDSLRHVRMRRELPIAGLPLVLGVHQLIETFVWWRLEDRVPDDIGDAAMWLYLLIAFVVLPPYVPFAVRQIEPTPQRRRPMVPFLMTGSVVSAVLVAAMLRGPVSASREPYHIAYSIDLPYGGFVVAAYVVATCGPLLVSGSRHIIIFGLVNLPVIAVLATMASSGLASLWCAWAAVTSGMINLHLRSEARHGHRAEAARAPLTS